MLLRLGDAVKGLPVAVLRPADMSEWARIRYERDSAKWNTVNDPDSGLTDDEQVLWERVTSIMPRPASPRVLVLGGGGGREAIVFARDGWEVTALDVSEGMLTQARAAASACGIALRTVQSDLATFAAPDSTYDAVWTSMFLYSLVLNRARRVRMLRQIRRALTPAGCLVVSFHYDPEARVGAGSNRLRRVVARLTAGNTGYQNGDILFGTIEFRHAFASEEELRAEFTDGGFSVESLSVSDGMTCGGAVLVGRPPSAAPANHGAGD
jgi:SAM-dependent methyltransferase